MHDWKVVRVRSLPRRRAVAHATRQHTQIGPSARALETPWLPRQRLACGFVQAPTLINLLTIGLIDAITGVPSNHTRANVLDASEVARFTPDCAEGIRDLTQCAVRFDCLDDQWHQIFAFILRRGLQTFEHLPTAFIVTSGSQCAQSLTLTLSHTRVDSQDVNHWLRFATFEAVGANDNTITAFDLALIFVGGFLDLGLNIASFDGR